MNNTKQTILDIAMNLNRIGNWIADGYEANEKKVATFLTSTDAYISQINSVPEDFKRTWSFFLERYPKAKNDLVNNAENFMTLGNILTHRSNLI